MIVVDDVVAGRVDAIDDECGEILSFTIAGDSRW